MDEVRRGKPPRFEAVLTIAERAAAGHVISLSEVTQCDQLVHEAETYLQAMKEAAAMVRNKFSQQPSKCPSTPPPPSDPNEAPEPSSSSVHPSRPEGLLRRRMMRLGHP